MFFNMAKQNKQTKHKYRVLSGAINFTNFGTLLTTILLILIQVHAKTTNISDNNFLNSTAATVSSNGSTNASNFKIKDYSIESATKANNIELIDAIEDVHQDLNESKLRDKHHKIHHHHHHHYQHTTKKRRHNHKSNVVFPQESAFRHPYRNKFTIDELLNTKFEYKVSNDIDMDPCKAGGFMGDIALPDLYKDEPFYRSSDDQWKPQNDAPFKVEAHNKFNSSFQQELEKLKQEVYLEGLQVEEEGLTDIIRKKTKLPSNIGQENSNNINPILSVNEPVKSMGHSLASDYLTKSNRINEVHSATHWRKLEDFSPVTEYFDSKTSKMDKTTNPFLGGTGAFENKIYNNAAKKVDEFLIPGYHNNNSSGEFVEAEKQNKTIITPANRFVDQRKIQSNTKNIELDSGNNFVSERKVVVIQPTSLPIQRSTLPNVYSNAGGNGVKLDNVDFIHAEGIVRRRHRRGRKSRRSYKTREDYNLKLQRLREELNRPVRQAHKNPNQMELYYRYLTQFSKSELLKAKTHHEKKKSLNSQNHDHEKQASNTLKQSQVKRNITNEIAEDPGKKSNQKHSEDKKTDEVLSSQEISMEHEKYNDSEMHHRMARAVTAKKERVWDYGVIPYEIDGNFSGLHKALFKQAMRHWENFTCIKFVERDPILHPNYIVFTVRNCGCCSFVGKRGNGPQAISIGRNCDKFGIVVHELGHVVGFWHEHTRPDREKHVVIELNNIMKGQDYNFNKLTPDEVDSLGMAYDYDSIMHYARNTFSKGTYLDTILPIEVKGKKRPEIGQRLRLSSGDIAQANLLYRCPRCGRTFQENTGIFTSPSYYTAGALTNETELCEWRITATHGERINLRVESLNLLRSANCETDYLEVRDGYYYKSPLIGRFCGKINGELISTQTSRMLLTYVNSHRVDGHRGFKAEFDVICGGEISVDDSEGRLESPNYPLDYLPNKECIWKISVPKGYQVALKFQSFEVENHDSCVYDYVEVHDGPENESPLIGVFCGYKAPPNMKSSGNTMFVKFVSDTSVQKAGFSAIFMKEVDECETQNNGCEHDCINTLGGYECSCRIGYELHSDKKHCEDACGGVIEYPNGTITSPSFPDMYPMLKECIWEIMAPPKHKISLNFTHFDLEGTTHQQSDCGYDYITIYSKLSENRLKRIGTYCGSAIPPTATSEGNALRVEFHSDKSIQRSGFAAVFFTDVDECSVNNGGCQHECHNTIGSYSCSCHNGYSLHENGHDCKEGECKHEISAHFGNIYSPNYPDLYPPNADCVWHFLTTPGHRIKLIFNEFSIESHQECAYDNVAIYDGESESSSILGRFCGDKIPYPISSSTNQLYMVLRTDKNKQLNGFTAMHSTACGGYLRATSHLQQFYSHARFGNQDYDDNMDCEWTIQAPISSHVQLTFLTFDIETSENCTYDYVQVFSGMEDTSGPMYGQYCGNVLPQDIISITDSLVVRFKTDTSISMKGYSASYLAVPFDPLDSSEEDFTSYSSEMVTPFPGSLKSIYKEEDSEDTDDYSDSRGNQLSVSSPHYIMRNGYPVRI